MDTRKLKGKSVKMEYSVWDDLLSTRRFWGIYKNLGIPVLDYIVQDWSSSGMQRRGKIAAAPTSDAAMPLPACRCCILFFFFLVSRLAPTRRRLKPIRTESGHISRNHWYRRRTNRFRPKFKKKKKVQNAPFGQKPYILVSQFTSHLQTSALSHSLPLWSLCSTPRRLTSLRLPSLTQSHSQESQLSTHSHSHSALCLPSGINLKLSILVFHSSHMLWLFS